jgi:hypothetical protein
MKPLTFALLAAAGLGFTLPVHAEMTLAQACGRFSSKLESAIAAGDTSKAKKIYAEGNKRIAAQFNGGKCPNVKAP